MKRHRRVARAFAFPAVVMLLAALGAAGTIAFARVAEVRRVVGDDDARDTLLWLARSAARSTATVPRLVPTEHGAVSVQVSGAGTARAPRVARARLEGREAIVEAVRGPSGWTSWSERVTRP